MTDLLFVEDDDDFREVHAAALRLAQFDVREAASAESAMGEIAGKVPEVILLDMSMPPGRMTGLQLLAWTQERGIRVPVVVFTGFSDVVNETVVRDLGVVAVVTKGDVPTADLVAILREAETGRRPGSLFVRGAPRHRRAS